MVLQPVAAARQHLVRIRLMADIPHQPVVRGVEDIVQRDRQFDRAEAGGEMTAHLADGVDQVLPQFVGDCAQLRRRAARAGRPANRACEQQAEYARASVMALQCTASGFQCCLSTSQSDNAASGAAAGPSTCSDSSARACNSCMRRRAASTPTTDG